MRWWAEAAARGWIPAFGRAWVPPGLRGQPGEELVRPAAGVGADHDLAAQLTRNLRQREPGRLDMISRGVRAGVPGPEHQGQRLPVPVLPVAAQAVMG
jgi:hypothetical protein